MTVFVKSIENSRIYRDTSRRSLQPDTTDVARGPRAAARAKTADYARPRERAAGPLAAVHLAARRCASRRTPRGRRPARGVVTRGGFESGGRYTRDTRRSPHTQTGSGQANMHMNLRPFTPKENSTVIRHNMCWTWRGCTPHPHTVCKTQRATVCDSHASAGLCPQCAIARSERAGSSYSRCGLMRPIKRPMGRARVFRKHVEGLLKERGTTHDSRRPSLRLATVWHQHQDPTPQHRRYSRK